MVGVVARFDDQIRVAPDVSHELPARPAMV
jgi:hypothetical protein